MKYFMYFLGIIFSIMVIISMIYPFVKTYASIEKLPETYYFLVLGMDTTDVNEKVSRTDSILLVGVNTKKEKILVLPIPRDLLVSVNNNTLRVNAIYVKYGANELISLLEDMFKVKISDYLVFDYGLFKKVGNLFAPVRIYVPKDMYYEDYHQNLHIDFKQGYNYLNGEELLYYARFRHDAMGDLGRIQRQKDVSFALIRAAKSSGISKIIKSIDVVLKNTVNSFDFKKLFSLFLVSKNAEINFLNLPVEIVNDYVKLSSKNAEYMHQYLVKFEEPKESKKIWVTLINNMESFSLSFYTVTRNRWTNARGYLIEIVDILPNVDGIKHNKSYIFIKTSEYKEKILEEIKKRYKNETFEVVEIKGNEMIYFSLVKFLSNNYYNTLKSDAIILVGSNL